MLYTKAELVHMTGITDRQFRRWRNLGLLPPAVKDGQVRSYTNAHLERIREIVDEVVDGRVTLGELRERFEYEEDDE